MSTHPFTMSQQVALTARGNVLVVASAGTGKTHTLIERCCSLLVDEDCSLDEILMVTFTEAAAAEMRKRIRQRLADKISESTDARLTRHLEEQLALLDTACISTLHSFCLRLVREHFHDERLRLDPEFVVLSEEQVHQLRNNTLDALLEVNYGGDSPKANAFRKLVAEQAGGSDGDVRDLIWQLHRYSRSLADPAGWFEQQLAIFAQSEPVQWRRWLREGFKQWRDRWAQELESVSHTRNVADCLTALADANDDSSLEQIVLTLRKIQDADGADWPYGSKGKVRKQIEDFFSDAAFLASLLPNTNGEDPLAQDWEWSRSHMQTLLRLAREFGERFDEAKREAGGVDFSDLEQFALRLLWQNNGVASQAAGIPNNAVATSPSPIGWERAGVRAQGRRKMARRTREDNRSDLQFSMFDVLFPQSHGKIGRSTPLAREWQARLKFVFVDEYQDINEAQDTILRAVSRDGAEANRFLVGDVKQSIYRFRLADPKIFQRYKKLWSESPKAGQTIPLSDNFRSREGLLDFVNSFFGQLMREEIGGVVYDADAHLKFGAPDARAELSRNADVSPQVEIHLCMKTKDAAPGDYTEDGSDRFAADLADLDATEKEARLVALQLKNLRREHAQVWDDEKKIFRAVEWRDMVVLLRSPRNKAEIYAREFNHVGVPLHVKRESFYNSTEISDLLSLLQLLDNPMQDLPLLAVLRSPLAGLSVDELAMVRAGQHEDRFWTAVLRFCAKQPHLSGGTADIAAAAVTKLRAFLKSFDLWRRHARQGALSDCVRRILDETHYESLILAEERGEERLANVNRLLRLLRQFDPYQRQGLLRFLRFVEAQRDAEAEEEPASSATADAVRLLSIHQSKGLEFPVVVVADLSKPFNVSDLNADILLDSEFGLCPRIAPPNINGRYPSLPFWLARQRQKKELLGEELRLLYVAMTRARDRLLLIGTVTAKQFETSWSDNREAGAAAVLRARSYADWLALWFATVSGIEPLNRTAPVPGRSPAIGGIANPVATFSSNAGAVSPSPPRSGGEGRGEVVLRAQGATKHCNCVIHDDTSLVDSSNEAEEEKAKAVVHLDEKATERLRRNLSTNYPFAAATDESAKTSVSALRRRAMEILEQEETVDFFKWRTGHGTKMSKPGNSAAEVGTVYHRFLERVSFDRVNDLEDLQSEADRMVSEGVLSPPEIDWLRFDALLQFWHSEFGQKIQTNAPHVRRELAFTARFSPAELAASPATEPEALSEEFVIVQGVADVAVILPKEIWLLDFKTDDVAADELPQKVAIYEPQLKLYARALQRIYRRPVTDCRLHFFSCGATVPVSVASTPAAIDPARTA